MISVLHRSERPSLLSGHSMHFQKTKQRTNRVFESNSGTLFSFGLILFWGLLQIAFQLRLPGQALPHGLQKFIH